MLDIYVHIGTHKTGTTVIQNVLANSRKVLGNSNYAYLDWWELPDILEDIDYSEQDKLDTIKDDLDCRMRKTSATTIILSNEYYCGSFMDGYAESKNMARKLHYVIGDNNAKILVYLRRQDSFIESIYTQMIHMGESYTFEEFGTVVDFKSFSWNALIDNYASCFGRDNIIVRPYDNTGAGGLIKDFGCSVQLEGLSRINLNAYPYNLQRSNRGYTRDALEIARLCNQEFSSEERYKLRTLLQLTNVKTPYECYSFFSDSERLAIIGHYTDSNQRVASKYMDSCSSAIWNNNETGETVDDQEYPGFTLDRLAIVCMRSIAGLGDYTYQALYNKHYSIRLLIKMEILFGKCLKKMHINNFLKKLLSKIYHSI